MRWLFVVVTLLAGCRAPLGECDELNLPIVYDNRPEAIIPLYAGQALMLQHCGSADGVCHAGSAEGALRRGVPRGFDFDVAPLELAACQENLRSAACLEEQARLRVGATVTHDYRELSWSEVEERRMPPPGTTVSETSRYFMDPTMVPAGPMMPGLGTEEGRQLLRNWLACGAPVVGAVVVGNSDVGGSCDEAIDETYGQCRRGAPPTEPPEANWPSVFEFLEASCGVAACHEPGATPPFMVDMDDTYAALVDQAPDSAGSCATAGDNLVTSGSADESVLYQKLIAHAGAEPPCGDPMPPSREGAYPDGYLDGIRDWINAGASQTAMDMSGE